MTARLMSARPLRHMGTMRRLGQYSRSNPTIAVAALFLLLVVVVAALAPFISGYDPDQVNFSSAFLGPSLAHPLGTDSAGRDLLTRIEYGARTTFVGPVIVVGLATVVGVSLSLVGAWFHGWVDSVVGRVFDGLMALPGLLLALVATALFGPGLVQVSVALSFAYVPWIGRITRSAALHEVSMPYIAALRLQGLSVVRILVMHLLPNLAGLVLAQMGLNIGFAIIDVAAMSYLGLGVQAPTADWGAMIGAGQASLVRGYPLESLVAGIAILLTIVSFNVIGDSLGKRFER